MLYLGAEWCRNLEAASGREWLETNGLGGFAMSTITGLNTRRYHGLLCAAIEPPAKRALLLAKLEETLVIGGRRYQLSVNRYPGAIHPQGNQHQTSFRLDPFPVFTWRVEEVELSRSIFLVHESNTAVVEYFLRSQGPTVGRRVDLEVRPLTAFRGYHELTHANASLNPELVETEGQVCFQPYPELPSLHFGHDASRIAKSGDWYYNFEYLWEQARGMDFREDLFQPFVLHFDLSARSQASIVASTDAHSAASVPQLRAAELARRKAAGGQLAAAADQFIVRRGERHSIIAGYPWFEDWGRDAMVALPGLTLCTARSALAREILEEFSHWIRDGLLPNRFPEHGQPPEYNSVDAPLWYIEAIRAFAETTGDYAFVFDRLFGGMDAIIQSFVHGTGFGIKLDTDGLLRAGVPGVALTWMDARINGVPVTPRTGKPVEIQALWYNALRIMQNLAGKRDDQRQSLYGSLADSTHAAFRAHFWNGSEHSLFDVIDGDWKDSSIRPNQIFAASLTHKLIEGEQAREMLSVVERELLTPFGLRTLSPRDPRYRGRYAGGAEERDAAYHQGTVWPWLMGPFVSAWYEAHGKESSARQRCLQWLSALREYRTNEGMNHLPEVFDGDPPHQPGGCNAQAWSLAMLIQTFLTIY
jgi:predicted glycogen debranching enzyme